MISENITHNLTLHSSKTRMSKLLRYYPYCKGVMSSKLCKYEINLQYLLSTSHPTGHSMKSTWNSHQMVELTGISCGFYILCTWDLYEGTCCRQCSRVKKTYVVCFVWNRLLTKIPALWSEMHGGEADEKACMK